MITKLKSRRHVSSGRKGGEARTKAKIAASRSNGSNGGRPRASEAARKVAEAWIRKVHIQIRINISDWVIVNKGIVYGKQDSLEHPKRWCPGCRAVPVAGGQVMVAIGGNQETGARRWVADVFRKR